jgi:hypothetical protein
MDVIIETTRASFALLLFVFSTVHAAKRRHAARGTLRSLYVVLPVAFTSNI